MPWQGGPACAAAERRVRRGASRWSCCCIGMHRACVSSALINRTSALFFEIQSGCDAHRAGIGRGRSTAVAELSDMGRSGFAAILGSWTITVSLPGSCEKGIEFFFAIVHPDGVGTRMSGTSRADTSNLARAGPTHFGESSARSSASILEMSTESPFFGRPILTMAWTSLCGFVAPGSVRCRIASQKSTMQSAGSEWTNLVALSLPTPRTSPCFNVSSARPEHGCTRWANVTQPVECPVPIQPQAADPCCRPGVRRHACSARRRTV